MWFSGHNVKCINHTKGNDDELVVVVNEVTSAGHNVLFVEQWGGVEGNVYKLAFKQGTHRGEGYLSKRVVGHSHGV